MGKIADILEARGQLDEALRIRTEEQLPVFDRLGDVRSRAVTMGQIADIRQARGQLDEALAIHADLLPIAEAMGDADGIAHARFSSARIRLRRGGLETGEAQTIHDELAESFQIARRIGRADFIGGIGSLFAQVLAGAGYRDEALAVLKEVAAAFETMGLSERVEEIRVLEREIGTLAGRAAASAEPASPTLPAAAPGLDPIAPPAAASPPMRSLSPLPGDPTLDPPGPKTPKVGL